MGTDWRLRASQTIGRVTGCRPRYLAGSCNGGINPKLRCMPFDSALDVPGDLDPYSARVVHAVARVGPAVAHIAGGGQKGRGRGGRSGGGVAPRGVLLAHPQSVGKRGGFFVSFFGGADPSGGGGGGGA